MMYNEIVAGNLVGDSGVPTVVKSYVKQQVWHEAYSRKHSVELAARTKVWSINNIAKVLEHQHRWYVSHYGRILGYGHKRRAKLAGVESTLTGDYVNVLYMLQEGRCAYCNQLEGWGRTKPEFVNEHVIPISRGGADTFENVVLACHGKGSCNSSKQGKTVEEYVAYVKQWKGEEVALRVQERIQGVFSLKEQFLQGVLG